MSDREDMREVQELEGVQVKEKIKYLGLQISCYRSTIINDDKSKCSKYLSFVKGKIQTQDKYLANVI